MIYKKKDIDIDGLWCRSTNKFYYLESGPVSVANCLDRVRQTLVARNLLNDDSITSKLRVGEEELKRMTLADAKSKHYEVEVIYLNAHIKTVVEASKEATTKLSGWT